jgi:hypothetical protein
LNDSHIQWLIQPELAMNGFAARPSPSPRRLELIAAVRRSSAETASLAVEPRRLASAAGRFDAAAAPS